MILVIDFETIEWKLYEVMHLSHTIYYTIISIFKKFKTVRLAKKNKSQADDIIPDACMQFEKFPIKTVGEEAFYSYYIYIPLFQNIKNSPKVQN